MSEYEKKKQTFITRTIWTFVMIFVFFIAMFSGHIYIIGIVTAIQIVSFKEVIAIANVPSKAKNLRFTRSLNWYFLGTTMYFLYGESVIYYFKHIVLVDKVLLPFAVHHRFISFMLYVIGQYHWILKLEYVIDCPRFRLFRRISRKRALPLSIHPICLDPHGALPNRCPSTFHHEQYFWRHDLVLPPSLPRHYQRYLRLHLRHYIWPNSTHQDIAQEDRRGLCGRLDSDNLFRLRHD